MGTDEKAIIDVRFTVLSTPCSPVLAPGARVIRRFALTARALAAGHLQSQERPAPGDPQDLQDHVWPGLADGLEGVCVCVWMCELYLARYARVRASESE